MLRLLRSKTNSTPLVHARAIALRGLHAGGIIHRRSSQRCRTASLGLDFGTESVRAVLLDCTDGRELGVGSHAYAHGQITEALPPLANGGGDGDGGAASPTALLLPPSFALQHPLDWIRGAEAAVAQLDLPAHAAAGTRVVGVGVDFTSCTMLPVVQQQRRRAGGGSSARGAGDAAAVGGGGAAAAAAAFDLMPLCLLPRFANRPHAWPKLWKHHGAASQAAELSAAAAADSAAAGGACATGGGDWLQRRYGGVIGLEWLFPKLLEVFDGDREVFGAATHFVEAGDWVVHALLHGGASTGAAAGGALPTIVRSACNAGYKACWAPQGGGGGGSGGSGSGGDSGGSGDSSSGGGYLLSPALLDRVRPGFSAVLGKLEGDVVAPGCAAGSTCAAPGAAATATAAAAAGGAASPGAAAGLDIGLPQGTVVSASTIDAHAGVVGVGVGGTGTLVCVLGTSACYLVNGNGNPSPARVQGVAGAVEDGIVPGLVGYEAGQSAVGDAFAWLQRFCGWEWGALEAAAAALPPGADGVACVEHFNGCRTPLMDPARRGSLHGLALSSTPAHVYRALAEASAFGCRWIVQLLEEGGVDCGRLVVTGGLAHHPFLMQVLADVLQRDLWIHPTKQGPATGAAIDGAAAAASHRADTAALLGFGDVGSAVEAMAGSASGEDAMVHVRPEPSHAAVYDELFAQYLELVRVADSSQQRVGH